ncbi:hypothetical protein VINE108274_20950 [Vibrio neptunius]
MNHFKFVYQIVKHEVSTTDLFILSVLATKCNKVYEHIKNEPYTYTNHHNGKNIRFNSDEKKHALKEAKVWRTNIYKEMNMPDNNPIEGLLGEVFPSIERHFQYKFYGVSDADAAGRIDSIDRLSTALHISTPRGLFSDEGVRKFIDDAESNLDVLESAIDDNAISRFLELYTFQLESRKYNSWHYLENLNVLADVLMKENLFDQHSDLFSDMFVSISNHKAMCRLVNKVIRMGEDDKVKLLESAINNLALLPFVSEIVVSVLRQYKSNDESPLLTESELERVFETYVVTAEKVLREHQLNSKILEYHVIQPLWTGKKDAGEHTVSSLDQSDVLRLGYLLIGEIGASSSNGIYLAVNLEKAGSCIDVFSLKQQAKTQLELTENALDRAILLSISNGQKHYVSDGTVAT